MRKQLSIIALSLAAIAVLSIGPAVTESFAGKKRSKRNKHRDDRVEQFADTKIFFEFNATDNDLGIQLFFDGPGWEEVEVSGPGGRSIFEVENGGGLKRIGSTEVFTESAEPPLDENNLEADIAAFLAKFPAGTYEFEGETIDGAELEGTAELTHALPAMVDLIVDDFPLIAWEPGDGGPEVVRYHAVAEMVAEEDGEERVFVQATDFPADITSMTVSPEFANLADEFAAAGALLELKVEVIAEEASGNKTITEEPIFELEE